MKTEVTIHDFCRLLRSIFDILDKKRSKNPNKEPFIAKKFKMDPEYTTEGFLTAIYSLEDAELAVGDFLEYGVEGVTKLKGNDGERYLRLYGVLNAVYMQYLTCRELIRMFKVQSLSEFEKDVDENRIIKLRNIAASHSVNYKVGKTRDYYKITRITLSGYCERLNVIGENDTDYEYNLLKEVKDFQCLVNKWLFKITSKIVSLNFEESSKNSQEYLTELEKLKIILDGDAIIEVPKFGVVIGQIPTDNYTIVKIIETDENLFEN